MSSVKLYYLADYEYLGDMIALGWTLSQISLTMVIGAICLD